jgi:hypothetical protein
VELRADIWARFYDPRTGGYTVKRIGKVEAVEPERFRVAGQWQPRALLGHGLYTSEAEGRAHIAAHPFMAPTVSGLVSR